MIILDVTNGRKRKMQIFTIVVCVVSVCVSVRGRHPKNQADFVCVMVRLEKIGHVDFIALQSLKKQPGPP